MKRRRCFRYLLLELVDLCFEVWHEPIVLVHLHKFPLGHCIPMLLRSLLQAKLLGPTRKIELFCRVRCLTLLRLRRRLRLRLFDSLQPLLDALTVGL